MSSSSCAHKRSSNRGEEREKKASQLGGYAHTRDLTYAFFCVGKVEKSPEQIPARKERGRRRRRRRSFASSISSLSLFPFHIPTTRGCGKLVSILTSEKEEEEEVAPPYWCDADCCLPHPKHVIEKLGEEEEEDVLSQGCCWPFRFSGGRKRKCFVKHVARLACSDGRS